MIREAYSGDLKQILFQLSLSSCFAGKMDINQITMPRNVKGAPVVSVAGKR